MKCLKLFAVLIVVFSLVSAKDLDLKKYRNVNVKDINLANQIYAQCLENWEEHCCDAIIMVIIKEKVIFPDADYKCLVQPMKKIIMESDNAKLKNNALTALLIISKDITVNIDEAQLYNFDVPEFFTYINYQLPKSLVFSSYSQSMIRK